MGVRARDDLADSFRLTVGEWWVLVDLLVGLTGYVVWVAGTAALGLQVASVADYAVAPDGGAPTKPVLATIVILWLVLPAVVGVVRLRQRLLNIRDNVEQVYRLDHPAALLVPPVSLLVVLAGAGVAMGAFDPLFFLGLIPASLYLLVRATAYSYRVYAFSHPRLLQAVTFLTLVVQAAVLLVYFGLTTDSRPVVEATIADLGLPANVLGEMMVGGFVVPTALGAAVAVPVGLVVAYLVVQTFEAVVVRLLDPTVDPSSVRTGQRYPAWLDVASNGGTATRSTAAVGSSDGSASTASSASVSGDDAGSTDADDGAGADAAVTGGDVAGDVGPDDTDSSDDEAAETSDSVSHTRVFTPPAGGDDPLADGEDCPECGAPVPADAEDCPACGESLA